MKNSMKILMLLVMAMSLTTISCEKEGLQGPIGPSGAMGEQGIQGPEGAQGPAGQDGEAQGVPGPAGPAGADGKDGVDGANGTNGTDGTNGEDGIDGTNGADGVDGAVNIMYSDWLDQDLTHQNFAKFKQMQVIESKLTNEFLNNGGIVLGFFRFTTTSIHNLPYSHVSQKTMREMLITPSSGGRVLFTLHSTDDTNLDNEDIEGINASFNPQYKYVLIPGGTSLSGKSQQDFKKMSYQELMDFFELAH